MTPAPREATGLHTRILKCSLEVEHARAYWRRADSRDPDPIKAFEEYWFGSRSLPRVEELLRVFKARFAAFPDALRTLGRWPSMSAETRRLICHWHVQLSDPLYRRFSGSFLVHRREMRPEVSRDPVVRWVEQQAPQRWAMTTRIQFASKLLTAAHDAGLVAGTRDPRPLSLPRVPDEALEYLLYLLRGVEIEGSIFDNPYLTSVGLEGAVLSERLRRLTGLRFARQADLVSIEWRYADLATWADARLPAAEPAFAGGRR